VAALVTRLLRRPLAKNFGVALAEAAAFQSNRFSTKRRGENRGGLLKKMSILEAHLSILA
jgi:hypothetical protein